MADEPLDAGTVFALETHGGVDTGPARALPAEHVMGVRFVEQAVASEVSQDASLRRGFETPDMLGFEARFVAADQLLGGLSHAARLGSSRPSPRAVPSP
jgi:hypothetical protein